LATKSEVRKSVKLKTANGKYMSADVLGPLTLQVGKLVVDYDVLKGDLSDDMLLGMDFLREFDACLECSQGTLTIRGQRIPLHVSASILAVRRTVLPPNSVKLLECELSTRMPEFMVEPSRLVPEGSMVAKSVHAPGSQAIVCVANLTDHHITVRQGEKVGQAHPCDELVAPDEGQVAPATKGGEIPPHLTDFIKRVRKSAPNSVRAEVEKLVIEYADIFASHEFDLGNFRTVEHKIDPGNAPPVKQRMRRTPLGFEKEEEAHLEKMLDNGVIQPSSLEWASVPVLVRKKDGGMRWCIDYRKLNSETVKDVYPLSLIEECMAMDALSGNVWFSKLDANMAYWQVHVSPARKLLS
jgi:hypothetical protein